MTLLDIANVQKCLSDGICETPEHRRSLHPTQEWFNRISRMRGKLLCSKRSILLCSLSNIAVQHLLQQSSNALQPRSIPDQLLRCTFQYAKVGNTLLLSDFGSIDVISKFFNVNIQYRALAILYCLNRFQQKLLRILGI